MLLRQAFTPSKTTRNHDDNNGFTLYVDQPMATCLNNTDRSEWPIEMGPARHLWTIRLLPDYRHRPPPLLYQPDNVVFLVSSCVWEWEELVCDLVRQSQLQGNPINSCKVFSCLTESEHLERGEEYLQRYCSHSPAGRPFDGYTQRLRNLTGLNRASCACLPGMAWVNWSAASTYLLPGTAALFPLLYHESRYVLDGSLNGPSLPAWYRNNLTATADGLIQLALTSTGFNCQQLQGCYALGKTSEWLARQICRRSRKIPTGAVNLSSDDGTTVSNSGSLQGCRGVVMILVDRTMDLVAPLGRCADHPLDYIYSILFADSHQDLLQPKICAASNSSAVTCNIPMGEQKARQFIERQIIDAASVKDGFAAVRGAMVELVQSIDANPLLPKSIQIGKVSVNQLTRLLDVYESNGGGGGDDGGAGDKVKENNRWLYELCLACLKALSAAPQMSWDELQGVEKIIQALILDEQQRRSDNSISLQIFKQLRSIIPDSAAAGSGGFTLHNLMQLMLFTYSLCGDSVPPNSPTAENSDEQEMLQQALLKYMLQSPGQTDECLQLPHAESASDDTDGEGIDQQRIVERKQRRVEREQRISSFFELLQLVANTRRNLKLSLSSDSEPYIPLVHQLTQCVAEGNGRVPAGCQYFTPAQFGIGHQLLSGVGRIFSGVGGSSVDGSSSSSGGGSNRKSLAVPALPIEPGTGIMIHVVGGVTFTEIRALRRLGSRLGRPIVICSSHVASGPATFKQLLQTTFNNPDDRQYFASTISPPSAKRQ